MRQSRVRSMRVAGGTAALLLTGCFAVFAAEENWQLLFDGKSLGHWKSANFGGEGNVFLQNGQVELSKPLGIATWITKAAVRKIELRRLP